MPDRLDDVPSERSAPTSDDAPDDSSADAPVVVGIGASAGGLAALKAFFHHVPAESGLIFVVVVHLSPEHESHLANLLQPHVKMSVQQVTETMPLEPDHVYVIPPAANLSAIDTHLRLDAMAPRRRDRAPIDHFFRTLAETHEGRAVGLVLTGTGSDGTLGIKEIKKRGGLVLVQDPNEAEFDGMPQSALATGVADLVLPIERMPGVILRFARTEPRLAIPEDDADADGETRRLLHKVFAQVRARTGRDFSEYKRSTILRRIQRRMQLRSVELLEDYVAFLRDEGEEVHALADDFLITVTNFFRDDEVFAYLEDEAVPRLFEGKDEADTVRVWSVGCATGEEAYSLAMLLIEETARRAARGQASPRLQVFASDLHERSLAKAREGFYPGDIEAEISPERLRRFFDQEDGGFRIRQEVRELVVFAPHNLLADPPFSRLDLIACRNVLIYLRREIQQDVVALFHYALRPEGLLVLGSSETVDRSELFHVTDKRLCVYRKRNVPAPELRLPGVPHTRQRGYPAPPRGLPGRAAAPQDAREAEPIVHGALHQHLLERFAPPSVLVSNDDRIVHLSEGAGRFLVHPGGEPTQSVFRLVREDLRLELRSALFAARETHAPAVTKPIRVELGGTLQPVVMHVQPAQRAEEEGFALVVFETLQPAAQAKGGEAAPADASGRREQTSELDLARQRLQAIIEEYETSQEEMRASNEELQSANEELRSTMEELETSKEELQSLNEELQTVNQENRHQVEELAQLSGDLQNLLAATDIATLFLDRELRIHRFTPRVSELFSVRTTDRGRPLSDLTHRLGYDELCDDAEAVIKRLVPVEREVRDEGGRWYLTRVLPYRSPEDRIQGVVITFVDVTAQKRTESALRESDERYRLLVEGTREYAMLMLDPDGLITTWNSGAERIFGYAEDEAIGRPGALIFTEEERRAGIPEEEMHTAATHGQADDERWHRRKDGSRFWGSGIMTALRGADGRLRGFAKVLRDNTRRKQAEDALHALAETLEQRVEERTRQVRELASTLTMAEQQERRRIAQMLHDDLQQLLFAIALKLGVVRHAFLNGEDDTTLDALDATEAHLGKAGRLTRSLTMDLAPPILKSEGLTDALHWLRAQMADQHNLTVAIDAPHAFRTPDEDLRVLLFQIVRELLFNVVKHAGTNTATVILRETDDHLEIVVHDDGRGFDVEATWNAPPGSASGCFGLFNVRERLRLVGGEMAVSSEPGEGTEVLLRLPLPLA